MKTVRSITMALAALLTGAAEAQTQTQTQPQTQTQSPTQTQTQTQADTPAARIVVDVAQFRTQFLDKDRAYSPAARKEAESRLADLEKNAATLAPVRFDLAIAQITALADNGHTLASSAQRSRRYERADVRLVPFGEDFNVLRVKAENEDLLGARLVAIDGVPIDKLRELGRSLSGGVPAWRDRNVPYFLESPAQLRALGVGRGDAPPAYSFITRDGRTLNRTFTVSPVGGDRVGGNATRWMFPVLAPLEDRAWRTLLPEARAPWALQEPVRRFRWRHDEALGAVIVEMRQSSNAQTERLADFFADVEKAVAAHAPRHLVLDLRLNGGGDLTTTRDFAEKLPTLVGGKIYALISPWTFSAAISTLGYLKQAAPDRVVIVGEPVGDRLQFFAEGRPITLTHSKEMVLPATERHDYQTGCRQMDDCHRNVVNRPIAVKTLDPDIAAPWTLDDYVAARDPAMDAVAKDIGKSRPAAPAGS
ncbi:MAG: hypothetical protein SF172_08755 [Burkholderiales bacterium]|nr:hypothetical protein [Burkholderiales bacterium]